MHMKSSFNKKMAWVVFGLLAVVVGYTVYLNGLEPRYINEKLESGFSHEYLHGIVKNVGETDEEGGVPLKVLFEVGDEKGLVEDAQVDGFNNFNDYKVGDRVYIYKSINSAEGTVNYGVMDYYHSSGLGWLFVIFVLFAVVVARGKGARAVISVIVSLVFFYFFYVKFVSAGFSPLLGVLLFVAIISLVTIPLIHGFNKKSLSSIISIFIGYAASLLIVYWFKDIVALGTAPGEDMRTLGILYPDVNLSEILIAGLFMGAIGALIDTAISISSAIFEALHDTPGLEFRKVYTIGMNVGKDVLGSMTNTLLFAYIASSLPFLIILSLGQSGSATTSSGAMFEELLNMDMIVLELTRTFIGAVSLVILIPIVSAISAYFLTKKERA